MTRIGRLYLLASVLWALLLGPLAALATFAVSAGFAWLYVFGDDPWPAAAEWILPLLGLSGGALIAATVIRLGYERARRPPASALADPSAELRRARVLVFLPILAMAVVVVGMWLRARDYSDAMNTAVAREASFAELVGANKKIIGVDIAAAADGSVRATVRIIGNHEGDYRLSWRVVPSTSRAPVLSGDDTVRLTGADGDVPIVFSMDELQRQYQAIVLGGRSGVLVDEPFRFEAVLDPVMTPQERSQLPPGEQRRIETPESPLRSQAVAQFPVRFELRP